MHHSQVSTHQSQPDIGLHNLILLILKTRNSINTQWPNEQQNKIYVGATYDINELNESQSEGDLDLLSHVLHGPDELVVAPEEVSNQPLLVPRPNTWNVQGLCSVVNKECRMGSHNVMCHTLPCKIWLSWFKDPITIPCGEYQNLNHSRPCFQHSLSQSTATFFKLDSWWNCINESRDKHWIRFVHNRIKTSTPFYLCMLWIRNENSIICFENFVKIVVV